MRPTLKQLQYLVLIADTGRYGEAARLANVSQSSLSAQIADMEAELDAQLLERGRQGAQLTPVGAEIVTRARIILREVEELKSTARRGSSELLGRINLGVLPSIGPYLLPPATRQLHALYPQLRFLVREEKTTDLEAQLKTGKLDLIISTSEDHPDAESEPLFEEQMWICAAPDDPLSVETGPVGPQDLANRDLISLGRGHRLSQIVSNLADQASAHISTEYWGSSLDAVRQMAIMGAGVAVLPSLYTVSEARRDPDFRARLIDAPYANRRISLCWRRSSALGDKYRALAQHLSTIAESLLKGSGT